MALECNVALSLSSYQLPAVTSIKLYDAYREMTRSNQAREDDALFAGIDVYDGEDPSKFEGWLDAMEQACNMTDRNLCKELMKKSSGAIRDNIDDERSLDQ